MVEQNLGCSDSLGENNAISLSYCVNSNMANEDIQNRLSHLNLRNLCLEIGYEKESPTRDSDALKAEVKEFLKEYESHGHTIPPCGRADPIEARLCATSFLEEDGRGERLFPPNPEGVAIWPINRAL